MCTMTRLNSSLKYCGFGFKSISWMVLDQNGEALRATIDIKEKSEIFVLH
jgi:hypothetical protein